MLKAAMAGIARHKPTSVVIRAVEMPSARADGLGCVLELAMTRKAATMPWTVPSSPTMGLTVPISAM
jgi:hypothetical protein